MCVRACVRERSISGPKALRRMWAESMQASIFLQTLFGVSWCFIPLALAVFHLWLMDLFSVERDVVCLMLAHCTGDCRISGSDSFEPSPDAIFTHRSTSVSQVR